jgi:putative photosynthetic complex assembly protein
MSAIDTEPFPRGALIAASTLIAFSLVAATVARVTRLSAPPSPIAATDAPVRSISLHFFDEANGSVSVHESRTDKVVATLQPGTNGFIRSVMRGLAHDRKRRGIGAEQPFLISQGSNGHVTLEDPATARRIDLEAFGQTNRDAFASLLPGSGASTPS